MVVKLLDGAIPPWLGWWNEAEHDTIPQAQTNERPHAAEMSRAPEKNRHIVCLNVLGMAHTEPDLMHSVQNALRRFGGDWLKPALVDCRIDRMHAVELNGPRRVTGSGQIDLMSLVGYDSWKDGMLLALFKERRVYTKASLQKLFRVISTRVLRSHN